MQRKGQQWFVRLSEREVLGASFLVRQMIYHLGAAAVKYE